MSELEVNFEPMGRRVVCAPGDTVLEAAQRAGLMLTAVCGGKGSCARCSIQVIDGQVSEPTGIEKDRLTPEDRARGLRLACQTVLQGPARVHVPLESLAATQRLQIESEWLTLAPAPVVRAYEVHLPPPRLDDWRADATRLQDALLPHLDRAPVYDTALLGQLSDNLRAWNWQARIIVRQAAEPEVITAQPIGHRLLGLAVDIGTTKLAAYLLDLESGQTLGAAGRLNPQIVYGEDVMARITYALRHPDGLPTLQATVVSAINELTASLCAQANVPLTDLVDAVVVGNTAMHHLFAGLPVSQLGVAPYVPAVAGPLDLKAREVGLQLAPGAYVHLLPNIAGFVGADHVAMLLASGLGEETSTASCVLGLDIGTNTEICLRARDRLWACSAASGPAFEGAHIEHGMRAAPGAIEQVALNGDHQLYLKTVADAPPVGLCGSGIVDLIAQLLRAGVLEARGAFRPHPRVRDDRFVIVTGEHEVTLSRADIAEIQLAKAAIRAAITLLLRQAGLDEAGIEQVILAGAFGTYLDVQSGIDIGLLPPLDRSRFKQIGNAAGAGARLALLSAHERQRAVTIARRVEYIELTTTPGFQAEFARALRFREASVTTYPHPALSQRKREMERKTDFIAENDKLPGSSPLSHRERG